MYNVSGVLLLAGAADSGYASTVIQLSSILLGFQLADSRKRRNFDPVS